MRAAEFREDASPKLKEMGQLYGNFDLDINTGRPSELWERRNLFKLRIPFQLQSVWFPSFWYNRVVVNRRAAQALERVLLEIAKTYSLEAIKENGLDQFVRCYDFGSGQPTLFWYGAGWQLSSKVTGDVLANTIKLFVKHGWHYEGVDDKRRPRELEFW